MPDLRKLLLCGILASFCANVQAAESDQSFSLYVNPVHAPPETGLWAREKLVLPPPKINRERWTPVIKIASQKEALPPDFLE
jgi:hypothetical protein